MTDIRALLLIFFIVAPLLSSCSKERKQPAPAKESAPAAKDAAPADQSGQPAATPGQGTIAGKVIYKGSFTPKKLSVAKDTEVCGTSKPDPTLIVGSQGEVKNAVVQIAGPGVGKAAAVKEAVLDQVKCEYVPHVLAIPAGTTVKIKNSDGILHNVHTLSKVNSPFNRAQPKYLKEITETFAKPERIPVRCDVHAWMSGWIVVTEHGSFDVSEGDGTFKLSEVPAGEHTLEVWHETLGTQSQKVRVGAGETVNITFEFQEKK